MIDSEARLGGLDRVEVVTDMVLGLAEDVPAPVGSGLAPATVLRTVILDSLQTPPCGVAFSGGRDSSGVLAMATAVARDHGLPDPVPLTLRYPHLGDTNETEFQESVVRHLGITEWERIEPGSSLEILGSVSTELTARHGLLFPSNIHTMVPLIDCVSGGVLLTGLGGDEILDPHPDHELAGMLTGRRAPSVRLLRSLAGRYVRRGRRRTRINDTVEAHFGWLQPEVRGFVSARIAASVVTQPLFANRRLTHSVYRMRYLHKAQADMARVATARGSAIAHPLLDQRFVGAVADRVGRVGMATRADMMFDLFGDLLPDEVNSRTSKAHFDGVFWTPETSEKALSLSLDAVDDLVVADALRNLWSSDEPKGNTFQMVKYLFDETRPDPVRSPPSGPTRSPMDTSGWD